MDMQRAPRKSRRKPTRRRPDQARVADRIEKNRDEQIEKASTSQLKA
jgi:hypothetical protein